MARTAFFLDDRFSAEDSKVTVGPNGDGPSAPVANALDDRPRIVWQAGPGGYYSIDGDSDYIDINEGGGEVSVGVGHMVGTGSAIAQQIQAKLNASSLLSLTSYAVTYDAQTARFTIAAGSNFALPWNTGTNNATSIRQWLGFSKVDLSGASSYTAQERRYGTDHWALFDLGSALSITVAACILDGGDDVGWNDANASVVRIYAHTSILSQTDRFKWQDNAAKVLTFSDRPAEDQNKLQIAFDTGGAAMGYRYWAFSWRYFDEDPYHAVGLLKGLAEYSSSTRQVSQLEGHGLVDSTRALSVASYYPSQALQVWRAPLTFDNWEASDYRDVVTEVVREGKARGLVWSLRWTGIADGTYDADEEADKGFLLWAALQRYSQDDYGGAASDYISGEITLEQVR